MINFKPLEKVVLLGEAYYILDVPTYSQSGYALAQYSDGEFICEGSGNEIDRDMIEGIFELD